MKILNQTSEIISNRIFVLLKIYARLMFELLFKQIMEICHSFSMQTKILIFYITFVP